MQSYDLNREVLKYPDFRQGRYRHGGTKTQRRKVRGYNCILRASAFVFQKAV